MFLSQLRDIIFFFFSSPFTNVVFITDILENALKGAKAAEEESQLESESSQSLLKPRTHRKPKKYQQGSESEDDGDDEFEQDSASQTDRLKAKPAQVRKGSFFSAKFQFVLLIIFF